MSHTFRSLIVLTILAASASPAAQRPSVTGTITYRERIALPPGAVVEVTLEDVSRADAPADVVARLQQSAPGQPPIPFQLPYDVNRINPRSRYAVRARILDRDQVLFTSTTTALVLTQGRGTTADLVLQRVSAPEPERSTPDRPSPRTTPTRPRPPVVELRNLPATFTGTLPCDGCPAQRYDLNLFPDDTFYLRTTPLGRGAIGRDDLGSWVLSSDRRAIVLRTARGETYIFAIRDNATLRKLNAVGQEVASEKPEDLRRSQTFVPLELRVTVSGAYSRTPDGARLIECSTGQSWAVSDESSVRVTPAAPRPGAGNVVGTFVMATGRLESSRRAGQDAGPLFVIDRVEPSTTQSCPPRFASLPMTRTYWRLTSLGPTAVTGVPGVRNEPSITFGDGARTFSGTGGCNRLAGRYQLDLDALSMVPAGTMMACPSGGEHEAAFTRALTATRRYRILGTTLELFGEQGEVLARFEGRQ